MAIDTRNKRSSAIFPGSPWRGMLPAPDATIDQGDRQATAFLYSGILAGAPAEVVPDDDNTWNLGGRGRTWYSDDKGRTWKV